MTSRKILGILAALVLSMTIVAGSLWAQTVPSDVFTSSQNVVTDR